MGRQYASITGLIGVMSGDGPGRWRLAEPRLDCFGPIVDDEVLAGPGNLKVRVNWDGSASRLVHMEMYDGKERRSGCVMMRVTE